MVRLLWKGMEDSTALRDDFSWPPHVVIFKFPVTKGNNSAKTVSYGCRRLKNRNCVDGENDCMLNLKLTLSIGETLGVFAELLPLGRQKLKNLNVWRPVKVILGA